MKMEPILSYQSVLRGISERTRWKSTFVADASVFAGLLAILYALFASGRIWFAPFTPVANISSSPRALPLYAAYSLVRISIAYIFSLLFALGYGFAAAKSERAAKILLPLLDILQSIPVLSFLPGVMLAMVALFPGQAAGPRTGFDSADFYGAGVEHRVQFLRVAERHSARAGRGRALVPLQRVAAIHRAGAALCGDRPRLEFDDVGGRRLVFSDGLRNVRPRHARFPVAGARLLFAGGRRGRRYARDPVGNGGDDRGDRPAGSAGLAAGDRLVGQIQI